ncbi:MAG: DEAD/DEAH box helicase [Clostridium sp.]|uniref:DEAD/DEAH box helicase n=1 Tax=Clostridium sp. TaxID=1506 RepID=UPI002FC9B51C
MKGLRMENTNFNELGLKEDILKAIEAMNYTVPSKIQEKAIPVILEGNDIIGKAQTGTGKTLAFAAPILCGIEQERCKIKALVLAPTRELALQVNDEVKRLSSFSRVKALAVYGGDSIDRQIREIKRGIDFVVGTPGRVLDLMRRGVIKLDSLQFLVLDEADEMLNMGFIDDIEEVMVAANPERQTLLFSATMPNAIRELSKKYMKKDVVSVQVEAKSKTATTVKQYYYEVRRDLKLEALCRVLDASEMQSAIIFCKTKKGVDELVESMQQKDYSVEGMHGDMTQAHRTNTLRKFKEGSLKILVATDVAARGIDVENLSHVINYDLPQDTESYIHRIGRTGRAGNEGVAINIINSREFRRIRDIERETKGKIEKAIVPTVEEIFKVKSKTLIDTIKKEMETNEYERFLPIVEQLTEDTKIENIAAALMNSIYKKEVSFNYNQDFTEDTRDRRDYDRNDRGRNDRNRNDRSRNDRNDRGRRDRDKDKGFVRLFVSVGKKDNVNAGALLRFFGDKSNVTKKDIGAIDIFEKFTFINTSEEAKDKIIAKCQGKKLDNRTVRIEVANSK